MRSNLTSFRPSKWVSWRAVTCMYVNAAGTRRSHCRRTVGSVHTSSPALERRATPHLCICLTLSYQRDIEAIGIRAVKMTTLLAAHSASRVQSYKAKASARTCTWFSRPAALHHSNRRDLILRGPKMNTSSTSAELIEVAIRKSVLPAPHSLSSRSVVAMCDTGNSSSKKSVMFVCLGNICRSPTAEAVFRNLVEKEGVVANK